MGAKDVHETRAVWTLPNVVRSRVATCNPRFPVRACLTMSPDASLRKIFVVLITLVGAELAIMLALGKLETSVPWLTRDIWGKALLDSVLLFCIMAPVFYWLLIRPLQRSNAIKLRFLDMASDDLRNPLNALQGMAIASRDNAPRSDELDAMRQDALNWMQLRVDRVVAFSTLEAGARLSAAGPLDLAGCVDEAQRRFEFMFKTCRQKLEISHDGPPVRLCAVESETLMQLLFSMLEIARMSGNGGTTKVIFGSEVGQRSLTRIWLKVVQPGKKPSAANVASNPSGAFERIGLARDILEHMAARARCDYRWESENTQGLSMTVTQPDQETSA